MKLSELLDHVATHVLDDRTAMLEGVPDSLWSPEVLCRYFRKAEEIFCRRGWVLKDNSTPACCEIALVAGQRDYPLHSSVLRVESVTPADSDLDLVRHSYESMRPRLNVHPNDHFDINASYTETPGRPLWFATDAATKVLRIRPTPRAEDVADIGTLQLRVVRMPVNPLVHTSPDAEPEIPEEYHLDLCDYVAGMALSQPNVDAEGKREARQYLNTFYANVRAARGDVFVAENAQPQWKFGGWAST